MPKENLINFIKERLAEGFNRKEIKETLLGTGFSQEEIEGAFYAIPEREQQPEVKIPKAEALPYQPQREVLPSQEPSSIMNKKIILILIIFVSIITIGGAFAFFMLSQKGTVPPEAEPLTEELPQPTGPIDCKKDLNCFIEASKNCTEAKVIITTGPLNIFGLLVTGTSFYEIKGLEANKCVVYQRTEKVDVELSDGLVQTMLDAGTTQEQIQQTEQEANKNADITEGLDGTCKFNTDDLTAMFERWKAGRFSTEDYDVAECQGELFGQESGKTPEEKIKECDIFTPCQEGFHCFKDKCVSNDVLRDFAACEDKVCDGGICRFNICRQGCENCKDDKMKCMLSSEEFKNKLCVECFMDLQCKSGYTCEEYKCVKG